MINIENNNLIMNLYKYMKDLNSFYPNIELNQKFEQLVNHCVFLSKETDDIIIDSKVLEINEFCSKAEFELEKYWANEIINNLNPWEKIYSFPYYKNYLELVKLEIINIRFFIDNPSISLFIGGGPLPLTSILLAKYYDINSKIIDISSDAVTLSTKLVQSLGLADKIKIYHCNTIDYKDEQKYDFVSIASLVFQNSNHRLLLSSIYNNIKFDILLTRSSEGFRQLLYKKIERNILRQFFDIKLEIHPKNELINSIILSTKKN